jgi:sugar/nucleoside kinase (ribokinase family)
MTNRIMAFGNPVYDNIVTPFMPARERVLSGCSTNACLAVSKLGQKATLIGSVGTDYEKRLKVDLDKRGIDYDLVVGKETGGFGLIYDERGNRELSILGIADPIRSFSDPDGKVDFVLFGPILGEVGIKLAMDVYNKVNAPILLDPQGLLRIHTNGVISHTSTKEFVEIAKVSTIIKANELETITVTGIDPRKDPEKSVKALYAFGCKIAIVTLAEAGSIIYDGQKIIPISPFTTNAIDPTGAGDTYAGGFMVKYLETPDSLLEAGCFASAVSSVMVENSGPDFPLTRDEANRRLDILLSKPQTLLI